MKKVLLIISVLVLFVVAGCAKEEVVVQVPVQTQDQGEEMHDMMNESGMKGEMMKGEMMDKGMPLNEEVKEFMVEIAHTRYIPNLFKVKVGDKVKFRAVAASGTSFHNHGITIDEFSVNKAVTTEDAKNPIVIEFVASKKGSFLVYCKTCEDGPFGKGHPKITATLNVE